jgi:hypothetical protein
MGAPGGFQSLCLDAPGYHPGAIHAVADVAGAVLSCAEPIIRLRWRTATPTWPRWKSPIAAR